MQSTSIPEPGFRTAVNARILFSGRPAPPWPSLRSWPLPPFCFLAGQPPLWPSLHSWPLPPFHFCPPRVTPPPGEKPISSRPGGSEIRALPPPRVTPAVNGLPDLHSWPLPPYHFWPASRLPRFAQLAASPILFLRPARFQQSWGRKVLL